MKRTVIQAYANQETLQMEHYQPEIILLTVRWYLSYSLSYRNLVEMMEERGLYMANKRAIHLKVQHIS